MFSRLSWESFQLIYPVIGFFLFLGAYAAIAIRAALMKPSEASAYAALPLEREESPNAKGGARG
jgi:hypothetical protein